MSDEPLAGVFEHAARKESERPSPWETGSLSRYVRPVVVKLRLDSIVRGRTGPLLDAVGFRQR